jgi:DNA-binding MarR family transcriptional regulator
LAHAKNPRADRVGSLLAALREHNTAAVMFHAAVGQRFGLSVTDMKTLDILQRSGPLSAGELAARTGLATPSVTSLIDRLHRRRIVRRRRDARDRRRVIVELSPNLDRKFASVFESFVRSTLALIESYADEQLAVLLSFLTRSAEETREQTARLAQKNRSRQPGERHGQRPIHRSQR